MRVGSTRGVDGHIRSTAFEHEVLHDMRLSGAALSEEEEMVGMPLCRRLLLILPSLVAGFREAHHKQGFGPA